VKTITIADMLHCAADRHLATETEINTKRIRKGYLVGMFTCDTIDSALDYLAPTECIDYSKSVGHVVFAGYMSDSLDAMGVDTRSARQFDDVRLEIRQQVRYAWLKFAALLAENKEWPFEDQPVLKVKPLPSIKFNQPKKEPSCCPT
jgi:hypothetical protein